jgi:hypothetical protein
VHCELLARHHQVCVRNRRFDDGAAVDPARGLDERLAVEEGSDPRDAFVASVGVFLAEVAGSHRERRNGFGLRRCAARAQEVRDGVVAGREPAPNRGVVLLVLGVHPVATESLAQVDHRGRPRRVEQRVEQHHRAGISAGHAAQTSRRLRPTDRLASRGGDDDLRRENDAVSDLRGTRRAGRVLV